jgi:hypothetical protein
MEKKLTKIMEIMTVEIPKTILNIWQWMKSLFSSKEELFSNSTFLRKYKRFDYINDSTGYTYNMNVYLGKDRMW